jgi:hypothetical protein
MQPLVLFAQASPAPSLWQILTTPIAVVGSLWAIVFGIIQIAFNSRRDRREKRKSQAELGFRVMDAMFEDEFAWAFLQGLDGLNRAEGNDVRQLYDEDLHVFETALGSAPRSNDMAVEKIQCQFDFLLYYLNRFEVSLESELMVFSDVRSPLNYYVRLLKPFKDRVIEYCQFTNYTNVVVFLERFDEWT